LYARDTHSGLIATAVTVFSGAGLLWTSFSSTFVVKKWVHSVQSFSTEVADGKAMRVRNDTFSRGGNREMEVV
jgi:hypothetical protein